MAQDYVPAVASCRRGLVPAALFVLVFPLGCVATGLAGSQATFDFEGTLGVIVRDVGVRQVETPRGFVVVPEAAPFIDMAEKDVVLFDLNSATVRPEARTVLDNLGQAVSSGTLQQYNMQIEGHTCSRGATEYNQGLSERRAASVVDYLEGHWGIRPERCRTVGYGETRPMASNAQEATRRLNRRVRVIRIEETTTRGVLPLAELVKVQARRVPKPLVRCELRAMANQQSPEHVLKSGDRLPSGGVFEVQIKVLEGCHLFVLFHDSAGKVSFLMPEPEEENLHYGRWVDWQEEEALPSEGQSYVLDDNVGIETLFVLASRRPVETAEKLREVLSTAASAEQKKVDLLKLVSEVHVFQIDHTAP